MANIAFKRGLSTNLPTSATDGVFYLTTDSHRLYVGQGTSLVELNRYILEIADIDALPAKGESHEGDFVWVKAGNMLLVCTDPNNTNSLQRWTQINAPDTDNDTKVTSITTPNVNATAEGITVSFDIKQTTINNKTNTKTEIAAIPVSFTITAEDLVTANEVAVDLAVSADNGGAKIVTDGPGADADGGYVKLAPGSNVTMSVSGSDVTINAKDTTYTLAAADNKVTLTSNASKTNTLTLADDDIVTLTSNGDTITAKHAAFNPAKTDSTATDTKPGHGGAFKVIDGITTNASGHITGYTEKIVTLPSDNNTTNKSVAISADNTGKLSVSVTDSANKTVTGSAEEALYYTVNGTKVYNKGTIDFYTKEEVDGKFYDVNAMVFQGTVGDIAEGADYASLPTSGVHRGWTYKVHTAGSFGGHSCDVGDLLIATGTEINGVITSGLAWSYVPAGDDTDSKFTLNVANNKISLKNSTLNAAAGDVTIAAGNDIGVSTSGSTITVKHEDFNTTEGAKANGGTLVHGGSFDVLEAIVTDNGHVTSFNKKTFTLPADNNTTYTIKAANNVITLDGSTGADTTVTIAAGNDIAVSTGASDNKITIKHEDFTTTKAATNTTAKPAHGETFDVLDSIVTDNGHITGYTVKTVTLPSDNNAKYTMSGITTAAIANGASATVNLTGSGGGSNSSATMNVTSTSLKVAAGTKAMTIDLEWGSF